MGKMLCECGYYHSDTCGYDGRLYCEDENPDDFDPLYVFECPECGNLMIDNPINRREMITYKPSNGAYNKILHDR